MTSWHWKFWRKHFKTWLYPWTGENGVFFGFFGRKSERRGILVILKAPTRHIGPKWPLGIESFEANALKHGLTLERVKTERFSGFRGYFGQKWHFDANFWFPEVTEHVWDLYQLKVSEKFEFLAKIGIFGRKMTVLTLRNVTYYSKRLENTVRRVVEVLKGQGQSWKGFWGCCCGLLSWLLFAAVMPSPQPSAWLEGWWPCAKRLAQGQGFGPQPGAWPKVWWLGS